MIDKGAIFSPCRKYRYTLWRFWDDLLSTEKRYVMFIGLNPSTADETEDDPTVRRCIRYAKAWRYNGIVMTNIFAYRATQPEDMLIQDDPVGSENDRYLREVAENAGLVIAAWGVHGTHKNRDLEVIKMISNLHCLHHTKEGHPGHPLYLKKTLQPIPLGVNQ